MVVEFKNINKTFTSSFLKKKVHAVTQLNLSVAQGEIIGIVGPNGAGKSTLLKMLMGFIRPDSGAISVLGRTPSDHAIRAKIGYLPENPYYYDHLSAEDLMYFSARTSGMKTDRIKPRIEELLETLNLAHARKRKLRTYSKGMTQRAGICFSLVHDPDLVIFDEPMSGLDPVGRKLVVDLVLDLKKQGKTVLFCSHILNDVERLCDRMIIMDQGHLKTILDREALVSTYREVLILTESPPENLKGYASYEQDGQWYVACPPHQVQGAIKALADNGNTIKNIAIKENALEKIFLNTIEKTVKP